MLTAGIVEMSYLSRQLLADIATSELMATGS
jgi:hypothetical protein